MPLLPWTCNMAEASVLPTLFSDVQVYVPSSCSFTRNKRKLLPLRISNLWGKKRGEIIKDLTEEHHKKKTTMLIYSKRRKSTRGTRYRHFFPLSISLLQGFFLLFPIRLNHLERSGTMCLICLICCCWFQENFLKQLKINLNEGEYFSTLKNFSVGFLSLNSR